MQRMAVEPVTLLRQVVFPDLARLWRNDVDRFIRVTWRTGAITAAIGLVVVVVSVLAAEPVLEGLAGRDPWEVYLWHAVHPVGKENAVPMNRGDLVQGVRDADDGLVALTEPDERPRNSTVDCRGRAVPLPEADRRLSDRQIDRPRPAVECGCSDRGIRILPGQRITRQQRVNAHRHPGRAAVPQERSPGQIDVTRRSGQPSQVVVFRYQGSSPRPSRGSRVGRSGRRNNIAD